MCVCVGNSIIVLEGLDGTGKSTVWAALSQSPKCLAALRTPPDDFLPLRPIFDACEEITRRTFYFAANYIAADRAQHL